MNKAFILSFEGSLGIILLLLMFSLLFNQNIQKTELNKLITYNKQSSLMKSWIVLKEENIQEMEKDFNELFPSNNAIISIDGIKKEIKRKSKESQNNVFTEEIQVFKEGKFHEIKLSVFFN